VFVLIQSPSEVQPEILDTLLLRKMYVVFIDSGTGFSSCGESVMDQRHVTDNNANSLSRSWFYCVDTEVRVVVYIEPSLMSLISIVNLL
jgi:hypothetical protein